MSARARITRHLLGAALAACAATSSLAQVSTAPVRPAAERGTAIVPAELLRPWDPVTIFFARDAGPRGGGPEDAPGRLARIEPPHPGAWTWLDARTLQFRPADPWPALARVTVEAGGRRVTVPTLAAAPVSTWPVDGATDLAPLSAFRIAFAEPMDVASLARMLEIELRPLPGLAPEGGRRLEPDDFTVKPPETEPGAGPSTYGIVLDEPVPEATRVLVGLRLALDDREEAFTRFAFSTIEPFRVAAVGCGGSEWPVPLEGGELPPEQVLRCDPARTITVRFTAPLAADGVAARNLVRLTPAVDDLAVEAAGRMLRVRGSFRWDAEYRLALAPASLVDDRGRLLDLREEASLSLWFPEPEGALRWSASSGIAERFGPRMVPVTVQGQERIDLRVHAIDAFDRGFWPFPDHPVLVDESQRPPGPGEEPPPTAADQTLTPEALAQRLALLGSPPVSEIVDVPGGADLASDRVVGLDLGPWLDRLSGPGRPGTYLVGIRRLDGPAQRAWMRVQVTDLVLTTVEEPAAVRFAVTSLATGRAVAGARVRVEGVRSGSWETLFEGTADAAGLAAWSVPGPSNDGWRQVARLSATHGDDALVMDATRPPDAFADGHWSPTGETWLQWAFEPLEHRRPAPETRAHVFTERPVYRPEETVHLKGWVRVRDRGRLAIAAGTGTLVVTAPGGREWHEPKTLSPSGGFEHDFSGADLPTGTYVATWHGDDGSDAGRVTWRMEAYRLPRFEVRLSAPDTVPLDREFEVTLSALYYAGGSVAGRPVAWRVTQFPQAWTPPAREGFRFSSDARYSPSGRFESTPRLDNQDVTDDRGTARLVLNPAVEPTADPRTYVVEATVTGPDDQTVTATQRVTAVPPFVVGVKAPRFLERASEVVPEILVVGPDGEPLAGQAVTVRLLRREWHSHLRSADFAEGVARYVTDVVDVPVTEVEVVSGAQPLAVPLPIERAGVHVVQVEAHDRLQRAQVVSVDLYAAGDEPVAWQKPSAGTFSVTADAREHEPGDTAVLLVQSPFQSARALVVVEAPDGNRYSWVDVRGASASVRVPVEKEWAPRIPVHVVLMRGRLEGVAPTLREVDPGKPATLAATTWLEVRPTGHVVQVALEAPQRARPGEVVPVTIRLTDPQGAPVAGEVALWLVDQAVLALGREQRLDPLPDFLTAHPSRTRVRDTRNLGFGLLPQADEPGGDGADGGEASLFDRVTVRKNFTPVPYWEPSLQVGPSGVLTVQVTLPDSLTVFKLRAKAASGADRFGFGTGQIAVRLPVIVEPALPRFVRPGDRFVAAAIARVVEGPGGAGRVEVQAEGLVLEGPARGDVDLVATEATRVEAPVEVAQDREEVLVRMAVERAQDGARDAFEVRLPVRPDRSRVTRTALVDLAAGEGADLPDVEGAPRTGTVRREVVLSADPAIARMAAALDVLVSYPYGCTEQVLSQARGRVALRRFRDALGLPGDEELAATVQDVQESIAAAVDTHGLVAFWPGGRGTVSLTAWCVHFLAEVRAAGLPVQAGLEERLAATLHQALRSDYRRFVDGEAFNERAWALSALAASGRFDRAYASELVRQAQYLDTEGEAQVLLALASTSAAAGGDEAAEERVARGLWDGLAFRLHDGREIFGGLQETRRGARNGLVLPSETRTLAEVTRAFARSGRTGERFPLLVESLVRQGRGDGWGSTNENAEALLALSEVVEGGAERPVSGRVIVEGTERALEGGRVARFTSQAAGAARVVSEGDGVVAARLVTSWVPSEDGSLAEAESSGFAVTREHLRVLGPDVPPARVPLDAPGTTQSYAVGDVVEEHVRVVNPEARHFVAIVVPLAAGMEPLNPALATAPPEARPAGSITLAPTYAQYLDDRIAFFYDTLPAGTYDLHVRTRATVPGSFVQPQALAEMMYRREVRGNSPGARVDVSR